jgi:hypothetical protein
MVRNAPKQFTPRFARTMNSGPGRPATSLSSAEERCLTVVVEEEAVDESAGAEGDDREDDLEGLPEVGVEDAGHESGPLEEREEGPAGGHEERGQDLLLGEDFERLAELLLRDLLVGEVIFHVRVFVWG